jgi:KDO2-lipid IV(A) lauroyltransferase
MKNPAYLVIKGIVYFLGLFPLWFLYFLADLLYYPAYYIFRYRRKVVRQNLLGSFPQKSLKEIIAIEKRFYRNLTDLLVEYLKLTTISKQELFRRIKLDNGELIDKLYSEGKSIFLATGHCGNWEWLGKVLPQLSDHQSVAIYKKLSNNTFDALIRYIRMNHGNQLLLESRSAYRGLKQMRDKPVAVLILADQSPAGNEQDYWTDFLNRETAFFNGPEKMAKGLDFAVLFAENIKIKRGFYEIRLKPLAVDPAATQTNEITEAYSHMLEQAILANPDNWLWSHKRFKHQRTKTENAYA